ncbi:energy-coupling factor transporter transmembrane protein EcfT [Shimazuella sp. AN120528]|nr:energy-coupling factor transporter transmembrane protein EcfT [Shimazuella soli]MCH5586076.1 energy-coupling factor transporter transmembrane protein EcfT [Shimazuella soli]
MKALTLYEDRNTFIHHVHPINKLIYIFIIIVVPLILPLFPVLIAGIIMNTVLLLIANVFKKSLPIFGFVLLILLTVLIIQGLFHAENATPLFHLGPLLFYKEGFFYALQITLRVLNIVAAFMILVLTTKPSDLVETLVRKGLSPKIGYVLQSVFQIIPQMLSTMETISDAQRSRGMETEGNLFVRIKAFLPLLGPVVLNSLIQTRERAMALEVRGFSSLRHKTFLNEVKNYRYTTFIQFTLWLVLLAAIIWRVVL